MPIVIENLTWVNTENASEAKELATNEILREMNTVVN